MTSACSGHINKHTDGRKTLELRDHTTLSDDDSQATQLSLETRLNLQSCCFQKKEKKILKKGKKSK